MCRRAISAACFFLLLLLVVARGAAEEKDDNDDDEAGEGGTVRTGTIIGIDLGTTYSCVGVHRPGVGVEIVPNDQGNRVTPSYVAFVSSSSSSSLGGGGGGQRRLVGDPAWNRATIDPENVVFDVKRLIGRKYDDPSVVSDMRLMPYRIVRGDGIDKPDDDDRPYVAVYVSDDDEQDEQDEGGGGGGRRGRRRLFAPEEISAMVLSKLKADAERYLGKGINRAVITVPAYFNDAQRHATRDAGVIAGLHVERIVNEPTAAAIAYGVGIGSGGGGGGAKKNGGVGDDDERNVLVFDLGGGTFDVTLLTIDNGVFEVLATSGDTHLGGSDVDQNVMSHYVELVRRRDGRDLSSDRRALQKLRREVERAKRALSSQLSTKVEIEDLVPGYDLVDTLTRAKFEEMNEGLFRRTIGPVRRVMEDAGLGVDDVHRIILVGGSTRIPRVQAIVKEFFGGREHERGVDPDESVAVGAAIQGSVLSGEGGDDVRDLMLLDVTPLSLGTDADGGLMNVLIKRGTTIPTESSKDFHTVEDGQKTMVIDVYEGERSRTKDNHLLGLFEMNDLPPSPRGKVEVRITFKVDANGLLEVTAENLATKSKKGITITSDDGRLSPEEIETMVKDAEKHAEEDRREASRIASRNRLESQLYGLSSTLRESGGMKNKSDDDDDDLKTLTDVIDETMEWLDGNEDASEAEYAQKYGEIDSMSRSVLRRLHEARGGGGDDDIGFDDEL